MFEDCIAMFGNLHNGACAKCQSDDDLFAGEVKVNLVNGFNSSLPGGKTKAVYETQAEAKTHSCSYTCNTTGGYFFFPASNDGRGNRCAECVEGNVYTGEDGSLKCRKEVIKDCSHLGDGYVLQDGVCLPIGNCMRYIGGIKRVANTLPSKRALGRNNETRDLLDFRPINSNLMWRCTNDAYDVSKNSCTFTCGEDFACAGLSCSTVTCNDDQAMDLFGYKKDKYITKENPSKHLIIDNTSAKINREYFQAVDEEDFYNRVPEYGCFYRCPEDLLYVNKRGEYKCYLYKEDRDMAIRRDNRNRGGNTNKFVCTGIDIKLYGISYSDDDAHGQDREWNTYYEIGGYEAHQSEGCMEGCRSHAEKIIYNSEYNGKTVCRRRCDASKEYFDYSPGGGCKRCSSELYMPDPNKENRKDGNPIGCVEKCPGGVYCPNCGENGDWSCKYSEIPKDTCREKGGYWIESEGKCVMDPIVYAKEFSDRDDVGDLGGTNRD